MSSRPEMGTDEVAGKAKRHFDEFEFNFPFGVKLQAHDRQPTRPLQQSICVRCVYLEYECTWERFLKTIAMLFALLTIYDAAN
nr:unnamed protein product [Spirometra erinaceieuropaei]